MNDRELLELAAKAVGLPKGKAQDGEWFYCDQGQCGEGFYLVDGNLLSYWNPLTDDGDALRLALKLGIQIGNPYQYRKALAFIDTGHGVDWEYREHWEDFDEEPYAATRRAIVRAAAEIGKAKEAL